MNGPPHDERRPGRGSGAGVDWTGDEASVTRAAANRAALRRNLRRAIEQAERVGDHEAAAVGRWFLRGVA